MAPSRYGATSNAGPDPSIEIDIRVLSEEARAKRHEKRAARVHGALFIVFLFMGVVGTMHYSSKRTSTLSARNSRLHVKRPHVNVMEGSSTSTSLEVTADNFYTLRDGQVSSVYYSWLEGKLLVEPMRDTYLKVTNTIADAKYKWTIHGAGDQTKESYWGTDVTVSFPIPGTYTLEVEEVDTTGTTLREDTKVLVCKYVRREVRQLSEVDREKFLDAMFTVYNVSTTEGKKKYGDKFRNNEEFVKIHNELAGSHDCGKWHVGSGGLS